MAAAIAVSMPVPAELLLVNTDQSDPAHYAPNPAHGTHNALAAGLSGINIAPQKKVRRRKTTSTKAPAKPVPVANTRTETPAEVMVSMDDAEKQLGEQRAARNTRTGQIIVRNERQPLYMAIIRYLMKYKATLKDAAAVLMAAHDQQIAAHQALLKNGRKPVTQTSLNKALGLIRQTEVAFHLCQMEKLAKQAERMQEVNLTTLLSHGELDSRFLVDETLVMLEVAFGKCVRAMTAYEVALRKPTGSNTCLENLARLRDEVETAFANYYIMGINGELFPRTVTTIGKNEQQVTVPFFRYSKDPIPAEAYQK